MKRYFPIYALCLVYFQFVSVWTYKEAHHLSSEDRIHLNLSTPTTYNIPPFAKKLQIQCDALDPLSFVIFTIQTPNVPVIISLSADPILSNSVNGSNVGLVSILENQETSITWFLSSEWKDAVMVQLLALPYRNEVNTSTYVPIPGACNQEFDLENDPNLHLKNTLAMNITQLTFAPANVGDNPSSSCDSGKTSPRFRLTYDLYVMYLGSKEFSSGSLFDEILKMTTVDRIHENGYKLKSFAKEDITEFNQVNYRSRGFIYNVIVKDPVNQSEAAYIPAIVYPCQLHYHNLTCQENMDYGVILIATFTGLAGLVICLFGHRIFNYEIFFLGFIPLFVGAFLIFGTQFQLNHFVLSAIAAVFGLIGGALHFALWWRFGRYLWSMLLAGLDLGFLFSSLVFFITPLENLTTFHNNAIYGLAFTCGVLLVPVSLLYFPKVLSILTCSIWGSYLIFATVSYFSTGILHYMIYNVMRRAIVEKSAEAYHTVHFELIDYILFSSWALSAVIGALLQRYLVKDNPDPFPACPYRQWKERLRICQTEPDQRERPIQQFARHDPTEDSPLIRSLPN